MSKDQFKVFVFDDDKYFLEDIQEALNESEHFTCVGTAKNASQIRFLLPAHQPDLILMDIRMPQVDGIQGLEIVKKHFPTIKVLIVTIWDELDNARRCARRGMDGFCVKTEPIHVLLEACENVMLGKKVISTSMMDKWLSSEASEPNPLTPTQNKILEAAYKTGLSGQELADNLKININTMNTHLGHIYSKVEVNYLSQAISKARIKKWYD